MRFSTNGVVFGIAGALAIGVVGCASPQAAPPKPARAEVQPAQSEPAAQRFEEPGLQGRTAVDSAIELSEKYAKLADQVATLREKNQNLVTENSQLKEQVGKLESQLTQTKKELNEANDLLIEMLAELNNWKSNILGFRSEMRDAAKAQLEALLRVLEILNGEASPGDRAALLQKPAVAGVTETLTTPPVSDPNDKK